MLLKASETKATPHPFPFTVYKVTDLILPLRVDREKEKAGLDHALHGESIIAPAGPSFLDTTFHTEHGCVVHASFGREGLARVVAACDGALCK
jgi:hypothetical protein